jgi:hypothetical protein
MKRERIQLGVVGVDSGQVIVCDPCYLDSEWDRDDVAPEFINGYVDKETGKEWVWQRDFASYNTPIEEFGGKSLNQMRTEHPGRFQHITPPRTGKFSYPGVIGETFNGYGGQLNYRLGHAGAGVASLAGYGDGCYPVYAEIEKGRVRRLIIEFF